MFTSPGQNLLSTYHHLVDGINYVIHFLASDVAVVVHIVQAESPCIKLKFQFGLCKHLDSRTVEFLVDIATRGDGEGAYELLKFN